MPIKCFIISKLSNIELFNLKNHTNIYIYLNKTLCSNPTYLQLLLLVSPNDFEFTVDHGGLGQVQGVGGHQRERGRGPTDPSVRVQGGRAVAGRSHGPEPRRAPSGGTAHAGRGGGKPGGVPENLPVG